MQPGRAAGTRRVRDRMRDSCKQYHSMMMMMMMMVSECCPGCCAHLGPVPGMRAVPGDVSGSPGLRRLVAGPAGNIRVQEEEEDKTMIVLYTGSVTVLGAIVLRLRTIQSRSRRTPAACNHEEPCKSPTYYHDLGQRQYNQCPDTSQDPKDS